MNLLIGLLVGVALTFGGVAVAREVHQPGEWSEWWDIESGSVKRIYDHENKLVCWIADIGYGAGISCLPSLELGHPGI